MFFVVINLSNNGSKDLGSLRVEHFVQCFIELPKFTLTIICNQVLKQVELSVLLLTACISNSSKPFDHFFEFLFFVILFSSNRPRRFGVKISRIFDKVKFLFQPVRSYCWFPFTTSLTWCSRNFCLVCFLFILIRHLEKFKDFFREIFLLVYHRFNIGNFGHSLIFERFSFVDIHFEKVIIFKT